MIPFSSFSKIALDWFEDNQRQMPWRGENDPYKIWVSEIILQQTRVNQGWNYYLKFIEQFPDVESLATTSLQNILHIWQGLGYYTRARNMHAAAQQIMQEYHGVFPHNYLEIKKLKGIGNYTAAAIASIAFHLPYPAVDGNVLRVISRIFGIYDDIAQQKTVKNITQLCEKLIDQKNPGGFNQALMELGAILCTPKNPICETCPFASQCIALLKDHVNLLPFKSSKSKIKERYFHYFLFLYEYKIIIEQRTNNDIWKNLFQFPMIETAEPCGKISKKILLETGLGNCKPTFLKEVKHKLTHQHLTIRFYSITDYTPKLKSNWLSISVENIENYPFPVVLQHLLL